MKRFGSIALVSMTLAIAPGAMAYVPRHAATSPRPDIVLGGRNDAQRVEMRRSAFGRVALRARARMLGSRSRLARAIGSRVFRQTEYGRVTIRTFDNYEVTNTVTVRARARVATNAQDAAKRPLVYRTYARYQHMAMTRPNALSKFSMAERGAVAMAQQRSTAFGVWRDTATATSGIGVAVGVGLVASGALAAPIAIPALAVGTAALTGLGRLAARKQIRGAGDYAWARILQRKVNNYGYETAEDTAAVHDTLDAEAEAAEAENHAPEAATN